MRLALTAAAALALTAHDCDYDSHYVARSFHPWVAPMEQGCVPDIGGGWRSMRTGQLWIVLRDERDSPDTSPCGFVILLVADTGLARALLTEPTASALVNSDADSARREVAMDPVAAESWTRDSAALDINTADTTRRNLVTGVLGRVGGELFLDLTTIPAEGDLPIGWQVQIPVHGLWHLLMSGDSMSMIPLTDPEALGLQNTKSPAPSHEREDQLLLVTAPTGSLYYTILHHARDTRAFDPEFAERFVRWRPPRP
jgi:hypothetical protein